MADLTIKRVAVVEDGAFGVLLAAGKPLTLTLEHTFDDNKTVITPGVYACVKSHFVRGNYDTFEILVPGHSRVLFHKGNTEDDSEGCVLLGSAFGALNGKTAVLQSAPAFDLFWQRMKTLDKFTLEVV